MEMKGGTWCISKVEKHVIQFKMPMTILFFKSEELGEKMCSVV